MNKNPDWKYTLARWLAGFGIDARKLRRSIKGFPATLREYRRYRSQQANQPGFPCRFDYPCPADRYEEGGVASGHYFHQDLFVAQQIYRRNPVRHIDVGSRVDGFVAHVASFRKVEVLEIRKITKQVENMVFHEYDLMSPAPGLEACCDSLSCLHVLEHFGLGRYGDPLMADGYRKGFLSLWSLLQPGGMFYLSVPIGPQRVEFNAHRVFSMRTILEMASSKFDLVNFSYVDDSGDLHKDVRPSPQDIQRSFDCWYGCGIFEFRKNQALQAS